MTTVRHSKIFIVGMDGWTQTLHGYCIIIQIPGFFPESCFLNTICGHTHAACGILVPWSGTEPVPTVLSAQTLNHWTTREVPVKPLLLLLLLIFLFWFPNLLPFKIWVLNWGGKKNPISWSNWFASRLISLHFCAWLLSLCELRADDKGSSQQEITDSSRQEGNSFQSAWLSWTCFLRSEAKVCCMHVSNHYHDFSFH